MKLTLTRKNTGNEGTFGTLVLPSGFILRSGELPWRDNAANISCIPAGSYFCKWGYSPKHGPCYHVQNVPGRSVVEIHAANLMGDTTRGLFSELMGCIALGEQIGSLRGQTAILKSRPGMARFHEEMAEETFELEIVEDYQ